MNGARPVDGLSMFESPKLKITLNLSEDLLSKLIADACENDLTFEAHAILNADVSTRRAPETSVVAALKPTTGMLEALLKTALVIPPNETRTMMQIDTAAEAAVSGVYPMDSNGALSNVIIGRWPFSWRLLEAHLQRS